MRGSPFDVNIMMAGGGGGGPGRRTCVRCQAKMQQHEGLCGRCWKQERKRREKARATKRKSEMERRLEEELRRQRAVEEKIKSAADESLLAFAADVGAEARVVGGDPALCAKCGQRPAVAEYELEENEEWADPPMKKAYLCAECANEVFPKEYDDETWPELKKNLGLNRGSEERKLFRDDSEEG